MYFSINELRFRFYTADTFEGRSLGFGSSEEGVEKGKIGSVWSASIVLYGVLSLEGSARLRWFIQFQYLMQ